MLPAAEDQQRINTFSKLNTRVRDIEEQLEQLKVSACSFLCFQI